jgi:hypothetical protein
LNETVGEDGIHVHIAGAIGKVHRISFWTIQMGAAVPAGTPENEGGLGFLSTSSLTFPCSFQDLLLLS